MWCLQSSPCAVQIASESCPGVGTQQAVLHCVVVGSCAPSSSITASQIGLRVAMFENLNSILLLK